MVETSYPADGHHDIATQIVQILSDNNSYAFITKEVAQHVLKPILEKHISNGIRIIYKLPEKWFTQDNETFEMVNELTNYFQRVKLKVSPNFINDIKMKFRESIYKNQDEDAK